MHPSTTDPAIFNIYFLKESAGQVEEGNRRWKL